MHLTEEFVKDFMLFHQGTVSQNSWATDPHIWMCLFSDPDRKLHQFFYPTPTWKDDTKQKLNDTKQSHVAQT